MLSNYELAFKVLTLNGHSFSGIPFKEHKKLTSIDLLEENIEKYWGLNLHIETDSFKKVEFDRSKNTIQFRFDSRMFKKSTSSVFFVAADEDFLRNYFETLVNSFWKHNPNQRFHIHVMLKKLVRNKTEILPFLKTC